MTYVPSPGNVADTYRELRAWVGPDAHRGTAAVALSTHHEMAELSPETRTAVLAMFQAEDEPCVAGLDYLPSVCEDQPGDDDLLRIAERLRAL